MLVVGRGIVFEVAAAFKLQMEIFPLRITLDVGIYLHPNVLERAGAVRILGPWEFPREGFRERGD
jgi:hypothetical protein